MKLILRKTRLFILLLAGIVAIVLNNTMEGYSVVFGLSLIVSSAVTVVFVFLNFDRNIHQKIVMEMIMDGFSGLVIFTYPQSDQRFFLIVFAFWIAVMGILLLTSGLMDEKHKSFLWLYALTGIICLVLGFAAMHYDAEYMNSVLYLVGFTLLIYTITELYLVFKRNMEIY